MERVLEVLKSYERMYDLNAPEHREIHEAFARAIAIVKDASR